VSHPRGPAERASRLSRLTRHAPPSPPSPGAPNTSVEVKTIAIDFSKASESDFEKLEELLTPLDLGVLVNNVGMSHSIPVLFSQTDVQEIEAITQINVRATLRVSRIAVPLLMKNASSKGKKSLILNLGSFAGSVPTPLLATYAGSKSFLIGWNRALNEELNRVGVTSLLLNTFLISTAMSKIRKSSWSVPTPKQYVAQVLAKIGRNGSAYQEDRRGREMTIWPQHALVEWAVRELMGIGRATAYSYGE
jgi:17beta-estradiol 17-dehydrogenase / very-long-chain 3-oxoacyl-CoA reductase